MVLHCFLCFFRSLLGTTECLAFYSLKYNNDEYHQLSFLDLSCKVSTINRTILKMSQVKEFFHQSGESRFFVSLKMSEKMNNIKIMNTLIRFHVTSGKRKEVSQKDSCLCISIIFLSAPFIFGTIKLCHIRLSFGSILSLVTTGLTHILLHA